ncbi:hypothetical protein [Campylobacter ureolyticus]|uniref:hypothetical protein n=1 Tax=Campylobacter ureolyticus TaxID=827 RepID=UPI0022B2B406|nr:hypothetical protein [Campylobacter ureolyticus]MCZ6169281.1 hypothetical protein [Campylobacter ureolyticus]
MNVTLKENLFYAFLGQIVSISTSFLLSFILPKYLSINNFAYWQLFLFYAGYIGMLHFGISDGILLRLGGKNIDKIKYQYVSSQFHILTIIQILFSVLIVILSILFVKDEYRIIVLMSLSIYLIFNNIYWFLGMFVQAINQTKILSQSMSIEKLITVFIFLSLIIFTNRDIVYFIFFFIIAKVISTIFLIYKCKKFVFNVSYSYSFLKLETFKNISVGIKLTIANISSILIIGVARFFIDINFGILYFNQVSFALSLIFFIITFLNQLSLVFFPFIKSMPLDKYEFYAKRILYFILLFVPICFIFYIPFKAILEIYLPNYSDAFRYMTILLPMLVFEMKTQFFCMTFYKVFRMEKKLLNINLFFVFLSVCLYFISVFLLDSIFYTLVSVVFIIIIKNIVMEILLRKKLNINLKYNYILICFTIIFCFTINSTNCNGINKLSVFIIAILIYYGYIFFYIKKDILYNKVRL